MAKEIAHSFNSSDSSSDLRGTADTTSATLLADTVDTNHRFSSVGARSRVATSPAAQAAPSTEKAAAVCPPTADYKAVINWMAQNIYDPKDLGNLNAMLNDQSCPGDLVSKVDRVLSVTGDKYDMLLSATASRDVQRESTGHFSGVGIIIMNKPLDPSVPTAAKTDAPTVTEPTVVRPLDGTPAAAAGLRKGDVIVKVDGKDTSHMPVDSVVQLIGDGTEGTKVDIVVDRKGQLIEKVLTRADIKSPSVEQPEELGNGITYVQMNNFNNEDTAAELERALEKYPQSKAFVIDLRDNPGGLLDAGVDAAQLFIAQGRLMSDKEREPSNPSHPLYSNVDYSVDRDREYITKTVGANKPDISAYPRFPDVVGDRPVVLLVNNGTASAAEIFTGAVHDTGHATTIGQTTYGKGIAQLVDFAGPKGTALKVTEAHYLTPSGIWPGDAAGHKYGLKPDIQVPMADNVEFSSPQDTQLNAAVANLLQRIKK